MECIREEVVQDIRKSLILKKIVYNYATQYPGGNDYFEFPDCKLRCSLYFHNEFNKDRLNLYTEIKTHSLDCG